MFLFQKFLELYVLALRTYVLELNLPTANPRTVLGLSLKPRMLWCSEVLRLTAHPCNWNNMPKNQRLTMTAQQTAG